MLFLKTHYKHSECVALTATTVMGLIKKFENQQDQLRTLKSWGQIISKIELNIAVVKDSVNVIPKKSICRQQLAIGVTSL